MAFVKQIPVTIRDEKTWKPWEGVTIKSKTNLADEEWIQNQLVSLVNENKSASMQAKLGSVKSMTLLRMIMSWTFTDEGAPVAVSEESISTLDPNYADFIYNEINRRNQPMSEAEQQNFTTSATPAAQ